MKQGTQTMIAGDTQPVRKAVSYRELFTVGWFDVREKHCFRLEIYDRLRASEQAVRNLLEITTYAILK